MIAFETTVGVVAILGLTVTALAAVVRIVRGPTILDRMIGSDVLLTTLLLAIGVDMTLRGYTNAIPIMATIAATAVLATIIVARYVRRRAESTESTEPKGGGHV